jgi:hypothetical protein
LCLRDAARLSSSWAEYVERRLEEGYAWFAGRADNVAHVDLLGDDGELTALGQRYVELDQPVQCQR